MRDYWLTQYLLQAVGWGYIFFAIVIVFLAWRLPKKRVGKIALACAVAIAVSIIPIGGLDDYLAKRKAIEELKLRQDAGMAIFQERCKSAGQKIYKTVKEVDGFLLANTRLARSTVDVQNRNWPEAGFPWESTGNQYLMEFLYFKIVPSGLEAPGLTYVHKGVSGYRYVEKEEDGGRYRYTLRDESSYQTSADPVKAYGARQKATGFGPRFALMHENISDPQGRENWVAGGRVQVIDRTSGEILAEYVAYAFEPGLGDTHERTWPWSHALKCPDYREPIRAGQIRKFVEKVLQPIEERKE